MDFYDDVDFLSDDLYFFYHDGVSFRMSDLFIHTWNMTSSNVYVFQYSVGECVLLGKELFHD